MLNGRRVDIPSILVNPGDEIVLRPKSTKNAYFTNFEEISELMDDTPKGWLTADNKKFTIKVTGTPKRDEADPDINEQLIVEYYSR